MIGYGFKLGLHGHQHISSTGSYYIHLPERAKMAVVSAGSVCAGARELPRGINRQYNVLVLNDELQTVRVHVREMTNGGHFAQKTSGDFLLGYVSLSLGDENVQSGLSSPLRRDEIKLIYDAEKALKADNPKYAVELLTQVRSSKNRYRRELMIQARKMLEDWAELVNEIGKPTSESELVQLVEAHLRQANLGAAKKSFTDYEHFLSNPATKSAVSERIDAYVLMGQK